MRSREPAPQVRKVLNVVIVASARSHARFGRLQRSLHVHVRRRRRIRDAAMLVAARRAQIVVTRPCDELGIPVAPALARLRKRVPSVGILLVIDEEAGTRATVDALRVADAVLFERRLDRASVRAALCRATRR